VQLSEHDSFGSEDEGDKKNKNSTEELKEVIVKPKQAT
jgi:hypothetical protein